MNDLTLDRVAEDLIQLALDCNEPIHQKNLVKSAINRLYYHCFHLVFSEIKVITSIDQLEHGSGINKGLNPYINRIERTFTSNDDIKKNILKQQKNTIINIMDDLYTIRKNVDYTFKFVVLYENGSITFKKSSESIEYKNINDLKTKVKKLENTLSTLIVLRKQAGYL